MFSFLLILPILVISLIGCLNNIAPFTTPDPHYRAPLTGCDEPPESPTGRIPGSFLISLREGYTFQNHTSAIGYDLQPYIHRTMEFSERDILYTTKDMPDELLDIIRMDRGVEAVECNRLIDFSDWDIEMRETQPGFSINPESLVDEMSIEYGLTFGYLKPPPQSCERTMAP